MYLYAVASRDSGLAVLRCLSNILWVKTSLQALPWGKAELLVPVERVVLCLKLFGFSVCLFYIYLGGGGVHGMQKGVRTAYRGSFLHHVGSGLQTWWQHLHLLSCFSSPAVVF